MAQQQVGARTDDVVRSENVQSSESAVNRGVKLAGEALVAPGTSLLLDGQVVAGGAHLVGGLVARALLGPLGWFLVAANSYTRSVTGSNLTQVLGGAVKAR